MTHRECPEATACFIRHQAKSKGVSVEQAKREYSVESGICESTLDNWLYPRKSSAKNNGDVRGKILTSEEFWSSIVRRLKKISKELTSRELPSDISVKSYSDFINAHNELFDFVMLFDKKIRPGVLRKAKEERRRERTRNHKESYQA